MAAQATDPGYRQEAQSLVQRTLGQYYNMLAHTPEGVYTLEIDRALAGGDNRFGMPAMETLLGYGMADVREWLSPALADGPIELSIVGDIDTEAAIGFVAKTFGALPARTAKPTYEAQRKVSYPAKGYEALRTVPTEIQRAQLYVFWPTTDSKDIALARRLNILADVLEDRIRLKLRDSLGGTYSPSTSHHASEVFTNYGFMMVQAGADPAETTKLLAAIRDVAETLRNGGITDDELERAKQPVLAKITETMRTNGYWLNTVMAACREQPRRLDWARTRKDDVAAITREEINQLAVRYLQPERLISYIVNPGPMTTPTPAAPEKPIRKRPTGGPAPDSTAPAESGTGESATGKKP
jgi:zinc protease